jgi:hypothetical protein
MGLDTVELVMSFEEAFEIQIQDADAASLETVGSIIDYVHARLPVGPSPYRLRDRAREKLVGLLGSKHAGCDVDWQAIREKLGIKGRRGWSGVRTLRNAVEFLVVQAPLRIKSQGECWSRAQVAEVVRAVVSRQCGVSEEKCTDDARLGYDLGTD